MCNNRILRWMVFSCIAGVALSFAPGAESQEGSDPHRYKIQEFQEGFAIPVFINWSFQPGSTKPNRGINHYMLISKDRDEAILEILLCTAEKTLGQSLYEKGPKQMKQYLKGMTLVRSEKKDPTTDSMGLFEEYSGIVDGKEIYCFAYYRKTESGGIVVLARGSSERIANTEPKVKILLTKSTLPRKWAIPERKDYLGTWVWEHHSTVRAGDSVLSVATKTVITLHSDSTFDWKHNTISSYSNAQEIEEHFTGKVLVKGTSMIFTATTGTSWVMEFQMQGLDGLLLDGTVYIRS